MNEAHLRHCTQIFPSWIHQQNEIKRPGGRGYKGEIEKRRGAGYPGFKWKGRRVMERQTVAVHSRTERRQPEGLRRGWGKMRRRCGAYSSEWQAERKWEFENVAGEIREWQHEGLSDRGGERERNEKSWRLYVKLESVRVKPHCSTAEEVLSKI